MAMPRSSKARTMVDPSCAGDLEMYTPASSSAANLAAQHTDPTCKNTRPRDSERVRQEAFPGLGQRLAFVSGLLSESFEIGCTAQGTKSTRDITAQAIVHVAWSHNKVPERFSWYPRNLTCGTCRTSVRISTQSNKSRLLSQHHSEE